MSRLNDSFRAMRLAPPAGTPHLVLDTDTFNEEDDQFALAYAALSHAAGELVLEAVYAAPFTHLETPEPGIGMELSYQEIRHILSLLDMKEPDFSVCRGAGRYLSGKTADWEAIARGDIGGWYIRDYPEHPEPVRSEAAEDLIRRARERSGADPLYVCCTGCPTNVASALLLAPDIAEKIVVLWLGGHSFEWMDCMEYNLRQDLSASRVLLDSGVPLMLFPACNTVRALTTTVWELEHFLDGRSRIGSYLTGLVRKKLSSAASPFLKTGSEYAVSKVIWDIAVIAYLRHPELCRTQTVPAPRISDDFRWLHDNSRHLILLLRDIPRNEVFTDLFEVLNRQSD